MHICIVGTGASGWITAHRLAQLEFIKKITIIGSAAIPTIGVGESTTRPFHDFIKNLIPNDDERYKFLIDIDAAVKYGVNYEGWSKYNFLHPFSGRNLNHGGYLLGTKDSNEPVNQFTLLLHENLEDNSFCENPAVQPYSYHFDANKFISAMEKLAEKNKKITHLVDTVIDSQRIDEEYIEGIVLEKRGTIRANYYISCIGQTAFNQRVFQEEYHSYSNVLLTDKALFYPLKYTDKKKQFHPYTVARTMKHGWRWITPTWSRIGTGYVFSSNHISADEAANELRKSIGDEKIEPHLVDFFPRKAKKSFKINSCTLGMAAGFLEPLDAPGLAVLFWTFPRLISVLKKIQNGTYQIKDIDDTNLECSENYDWWASFILHQYKTCVRSDTKFWIDHKNVKFEFYEKLTENLFNVKFKNWNFDFRSVHPEIKPREYFMFYNTTAGKDINWPVEFQYPIKKKTPLKNIKLENHFEFFQKIHSKYTCTDGGEV
jgi:tryptophan halogenase